MKAILYGDYALHCDEIPAPVPAADEVLVRVRAAGFNAMDRYFYPIRPKTAWLHKRSGRPGSDFAGDVVAVGADVSAFKPGDAVFGAVRGALSEFVVIKADRIAPKPANATFEQAAALAVAGLTALQALRDVAQVQRGQQILIVGAAGGVGSFAVQIAKAFGGIVTGVTSTERLGIVASLGAHHVLDYTRDDYLRGDVLYDVIADCGGYRSLRDCRRALTPHGTYVGIGANVNAIWTLLPRLAAMAILYRFSARRMRFFMAHISTVDLDVLKDMMEARTLEPLVPRIYQFSEVADALRDFQGGRVFGKAVISMS